MKNSFLNNNELQKLKFKKIGKNVLISRFAQFYDEEKIEIGNDVRIDDFCILSGSIKIGSFVHISAFCALYGSKGIELCDFSGISARTTIYSASDDFSGNYMIGPMLPKKITNVTGGKVTLKRFVQVGAGSVILPNLTIEEGTVTGAMTLVTKSLDSWGIYTGIPAKRLRNREKVVLNLLSDLNPMAKNLKP
jgi:galactoside O-acetyltransferase